MGLASVIHPGMPRVSLPPKWTRLQLIHHQIITISTGLSFSLSPFLLILYFINIKVFPSYRILFNFGLAVAHNNRRAEFYPIACSRGTEQEDHLSTSGEFCVTTLTLKYYSANFSYGGQFCANFYYGGQFLALIFISLYIYICDFERVY
jgi:hypothetical protein